MRHFLYQQTTKKPKQDQNQFCSTNGPKICIDINIRNTLFLKKNPVENEKGGRGVEGEGSHNMVIVT